MNVIVSRLQDGILRQYGENILSKCNRNHKSCYFKYSKVVRKFIDDNQVNLSCPKCGNGNIRNKFIDVVIK